MSVNINSGDATLREALYALSTAKEIPDANVVDEVVRQYPQFSEELTECAIALVLDALKGDRVAETAESAIDPSVVTPAVSRALSHFQNRLHALTHGDNSRVATARIATTTAVNPFSSLTRSQFRNVVAQLNANNAFVGKLRDREIDPNTMTEGFRRRICEVLSAPLELVVAHFAAGPTLSARQFHKADGKPSVGSQQSFQDAVKTSGLTEAQQRVLLEL